jgi:transposase
MVTVPDGTDEDARRCVRERTELISEHVGLTNRIAAFLQRLQPVAPEPTSSVAELQIGLGEPLPPNAHAKIARSLAGTRTGR